MEKIRIVVSTNNRIFSYFYLVVLFVFSNFAGALITKN